MPEQLCGAELGHQLLRHVDGHLLRRDAGDVPDVDVELEQQQQQQRLLTRRRAGCDGPTSLLRWPKPLPVRGEGLAVLSLFERAQRAFRQRSTSSGMTVAPIWSRCAMWCSGVLPR